MVTPLGIARAGLSNLLDPFPFIWLRTKAGEVLTSTKQLVLRRDGDDADIPHDLISDVLARLRFVARQPLLPRHAIAFTTTDPLRFDGALPAAAELPGYSIRNDLFETAITHEHLTDLGEPRSTPEVPVEVMLDALAARVEGDIRKTILYSAIAVEARAADVLDRAYEEAKLARTARHHIVDIANRNGVVTVDPVFEALPDRLRALLHERPLYLQGRSLLLEDKPTYDRAVKLYTTRNKVVHRGTHDEEGECFPLTRDGAEAALHAAIDTLRWLGDAGPYVVSGDFVRPCD